MKNLIITTALFCAGIQVNAQTTVDCQVYGNPEDFLELANTLFRVDGSLDEGEYNSCGTESAIIVGIIDPTDDCNTWGTYYETDTLTHNPENDFGNSNSNGGCRPRIEKHFVFMQNDPVQLDSLNSLLTNKIPNGYHVIIYSWFNLDAPAISGGYPELVATFNDLGWTGFDLALGDVPFILYAEIGSPLFAQEVYGEAPEDYIVFEESFECDLISYADTVYTMPDDSNASDNEVVISEGVGVLEEVNGLTFAINNSSIIISGTGIENYQIQNIFTLDGKEIDFKLEQNATEIRLSPISINNAYLVINLLKSDGSQIRKLVPFGL